MAILCFLASLGDGLVTAALEFESVSVRHGDGSHALRDVSFRIGKGERVALLGLNGSGKTSLLLAAAGLIAHEGEIRIGGKRLTRRNAFELREGLGIVFAVPEDQLLMPVVHEDVAFGLIRRGISPKEAKVRAFATLEKLGAAPLVDRASYELSHGERLRVAIAGAITTEPNALLFDEPSSGLDPPGVWNLANLLSGLRAAMCIATHDLDFARRCCERFVLLEGGGVRGEGSIDLVESIWSPG